jgi:hypothetical protein
MSAILLCDNERFYLEPEGRGGDNLTVSYSDGGEIHVGIEEPWAGDTETGFGAVCGLTLSRGEAKALAEWILARCGGG